MNEVDGMKQEDYSEDWVTSGYIHAHTSVNLRHNN